MTQERNGSPRFFELLSQMGDIHERKNQDYSPGEDPFRNFRRSEKIGIPAFAGAYTRLGDKIERCDSLIANVLAGKGENAAVLDESLWDTLLDGANYFLIVACLYEQYLQAIAMRPIVEDDDVDDGMTVLDRVHDMRERMQERNSEVARNRE